MAIDAGTVARIIQSRTARAGFDPARLGGHSRKRGALRTGMARGVHPTRLKQLGRHKSYHVRFQGFRTQNFIRFFLFRLMG